MNLKEENEELREVLELARSHIVELCRVMKIPLPDATIHRIDSALSQQDDDEVASPAQDERENWSGALLQVAVVLEALRSSDSATRLANMDAGKVLGEAYEKLKRIRATRPAQKVNNVDTPEQQERWQVRYLPGQKVEERWWQDSTAERAAWCAEANAEQLAKGLPDVWEIRKFYTAPQPQPVAWARQCDLTETREKFARLQPYRRPGYDVPLYAAPIAQTAPLPEQVNAFEALQHAVAYLARSPLEAIHSGSALHKLMVAALSAQGSK